MGNAHTQAESQNGACRQPTDNPAPAKLGATSTTASTSYIRVNYVNHVERLFNSPRAKPTTVEAEMPPRLPARHSDKDRQSRITTRPRGGRHTESARGCQLARTLGRACEPPLATKSTTLETAVCSTAIDERNNDNDVSDLEPRGRRRAQSARRRSSQTFPGTSEIAVAGAGDRRAKTSTATS